MRLAAVVFLACLPTAAFAGDLDSGQIRSQLVGQPIIWWDEGGWVSGEMMLLPDGRAELDLRTPRASRDAGQWTLEGDAICTTWSSLRSGQTKCYTVRSSGDGRFLTSGGNVFEIRAAGV